MAHQVLWNKIIMEEFIELASLSKDEEMIIRTVYLSDNVINLRSF